MLKNFAALSIKLPLYFNYSVGYVGIGLMTNVVVTWAMYFYSPPLSSGRTIYMSAAAFGLIIALGRIVDAFTDPLISVWSDGFRSPYGRRIPFIAAGALPTVLAFIFIWYPPVPGPAALNTVYLMAMLGLMFLGLTVITCPFLALMPEIATTPGERMRAAEGIALAHIAAVATAMLGAAFFIEEFGFQAMAIFAGTVALVSFLSPVLTVREAPRDSSREAFSFRESLLLTLKNRVFLPYILSLPFFWFGFNFVLMGIPYITTVQIGLSESMVGIALVLAMLVALASFPLVRRLSLVKGKKYTFSVTMLCSSLLLMGMASVGSWPGFIPVAVQGMAFIAAAGIPLAGLFILPNALLADITDEDERNTGQRREAVYYGMQGLVMKGTIGLSALVLGLQLEAFGYSADSYLGILLIGPVAGLCLLAGLAIFRRYPLA